MEENLLKEIKVVLTYHVDTHGTRYIYNKSRDLLKKIESTVDMSIPQTVGFLGEYWELQRVFRQAERILKYGGDK